MVAVDPNQSKIPRRVQRFDHATLAARTSEDRNDRKARELPRERLLVQKRLRCAMDRPFMNAGLSPARNHKVIH